MKTLTTRGSSESGPVVREYTQNRIHLEIPMAEFLVLRIGWKLAKCMHYENRGSVFYMDCMLHVVHLL